MSDRVWYLTHTVTVPWSFAEEVPGAVASTMTYIRAETRSTSRFVVHTSFWVGVLPVHDDG